jgi:hypothetical protein
MVQQMQKSQPIEAFRSALNKPFPADKVDEILKYYNASISDFRLDKYAECIVDAGKVAEAVLKCFHYLRTQEVVDAVRVEQEVIQLENCTSLSDSERMTIPRTLRLIYEHRNRRGAAHNNSFNPNQMDAVLVIAELKWVLGELARLYLTSDSDEAQRLVTNLLARDLPLVEEIDGAYLILLPDLPARIQLEILLYRHYPNRCQFKDLVAWIGNAHSESNIRVTLSNLKKKALAHENQDGWRLTESGLKEAISEITQIQPGNNTSNNHRTVKTKGTKHGRRR